MCTLNVRAALLRARPCPACSHSLSVSSSCMPSSRCVAVLPPLARAAAGVSPAHLGKKTSKLAWFSHSADSQDGMCATLSGRLLLRVCDTSPSVRVCVCVLSRGRTCVCVENLMARCFGFRDELSGSHEGVKMHRQLAALSSLLYFPSLASL